MPVGAGVSDNEAGPQIGAGRRAFAHRIAVAAYCAAGAAFVVWVVWGGGSPRQRTVISDAAFLPVGPGAAWFAWRAAHRGDTGRRARKGWTLIALGALSWGIGDALWFVLEVVGDIAPFPSVADVFYLGFYPLIAVGVAFVTPEPLTRGERLRFALDALTLTAVAAPVAWSAAIAPSMGAVESRLAQILTVAYPIGDVVIAFGIATILLRRRATSSASVLRLLLAAALAFVAADLLYARQSAAGTYLGGDAPDALWMVALVLLLVAGYAQSEQAQPGLELPSRTAVGRVSPVPYVAVVAAFALVLLSMPAGGTDLVIAAGAMFLVAVLVSTRQLLALRDNFRLNDELQRLAGDLEQALVETRTAQEVARDEQERRRRFLADAAHQLRTPVAGLHASAETLLRGAPPATVEELLLSIGQESARAGRIIAELLALARLDENVPLRRTPTDLVALCEEEAARARAQVVGVAVTVGRSDAAGPSIAVDSDAVRAILTNLIENASRHAAHSIEVVVERGDASVNVLVRDDGPGLDPALAEDVFERFVSLDGNRGGGLGLAIARGYARAHDGDLRYEDGAFVLSLPCRAAAAS